MPTVKVGKKRNFFKVEKNCQHLVLRNGFYMMGRYEGEIFEKSIKPV